MSTSRVAAKTHKSFGVGKKVLNLLNAVFRVGEKKTSQWYLAASGAEHVRIWKLGSQCRAQEEKKNPERKIISEGILV